jgi:NAD(P)-dependent dehydrogenase (short-subunit alcohol dehydrogenase family)
MWDDPKTWSVIVTGGSSGLGAATCRQLAGAGADVLSLDRRPSAEVVTILADLADSAGAADATERAIEKLDGVDAVVCCAGTDNPGSFLDIDRQDWERVLAVNLLGTAAVLRAAWPSLLDRGGRAVTVASTLGHRAVGDATAYCASKFGVIGLTRALAAEFKGRVGVTLLTPGGMRTGFFDDRDEQYKPPPDASLADPDDVAAAVVWALRRPAGLEIKELTVMSPAESSWP